MDFQKFMDMLISVVPPEQQPDEVVLRDEEFDELGFSRAICWQSSIKNIRIRKRSEWLAEIKYESKIEALESRVTSLEAQLTKKGD